jgi:hypothetical protein
MILHRHVWGEWSERLILLPYSTRLYQVRTCVRCNTTKTRSVKAK